MDSLLQLHRNEILSLAAKHGAGNVRVFGSRARGDARDASDVDLLIDITGPTTPWFPGGLIEELRILLGRPVDVGLESELSPTIREQVVKEAQPL